MEMARGIASDENGGNLHGGWRGVARSTSSVRQARRSSQREGRGHAAAPHQNNGPSERFMRVASRARSPCLSRIQFLNAEAAVRKYGAAAAAGAIELTTKKADDR